MEITTIENLSLLNDKVENFKNSSEYQNLERLILESSNEAWMAVDPGTIIAVAGFVSDIFSFFSGNDTSQLNKLMDAIGKNLKQIIDLLTNVVQILSELKVLIKEETRNYVVTTLRSQMMIISDNFEMWHTNKIKYKDEIIANYLELNRRLYDSIQYGYCHYDSIAVAASQAYSLSLLLEDGKSRIQKLFPNVVHYFTQAMNPEENNSIAYNIKMLSEQINQLINNYTAGNIYCGWHWRSEGRCRIASYLYLPVSGNIQSGFSYGAPFINGEIKKECEPRDTGHDKPFNFEKTESNSYPSIQDAQNDYEKARNFYLHLISQVDVLRKSYESCQKYKGYVQNLL